MNKKQRKLYPETANWPNELLQFLREQKILESTGK